MKSYSWVFALAAGVACSSTTAPPGNTDLDATRGGLAQAPNADGTCDPGLRLCERLCQLTCNANIDSGVNPALDAAAAQDTGAPLAEDAGAALDAATAPRRAVDVVSGDTSCAIREGAPGSAKGDVYCWGSDTSGALGQGAAVAGGESLAPLKVLGLAPDIVKLSLNTDGARCAIANSGEMKCWGAGFSATPALHPLFGRDISDFSGQCAIRKSDGSVACLEGGAAVAVAAVGIGAKALTGFEVPAGWGHCAITQARNVVCWGVNNNYRLGVDGLNNVVSPSMLAGVTNAAQIAFSGRGAAMVDTAGALWLWGYAPFPAGAGLPSLPNTSASSPARTNVTGVESLGGSWQYYIVAAQDGKTSVTGPASSAKPFPGIGLTTPFTAQGGSPFVRISTRSFTNATIVPTGGDFEGSACAVTRLGAVYCWGTNGFGQIGDGTKTPQAQPSRVQL